MAPQQIEPAVPTRLSTVSVSHTSRKLRVAGTSVLPSRSTCGSAYAYVCGPRLLAYDVSTGLALLVERDLSRALLIDVSMCVDPSRTAPWLRDKRSVVIVTAYVEQVDVSPSQDISRVSTLTGLPDGDGY